MSRDDAHEFLTLADNPDRRLAIHSRAWCEMKWWVTRATMHLDYNGIITLSIPLVRRPVPESGPVPVGAPFPLPEPASRHQMQPSIFS